LLIGDRVEKLSKYFICEENKKAELPLEKLQANSAF
jgi:hypothetical protein